jgi:scyllo-inositol 2-dehydrogenase (NADP+)
MPDLRGAIIGYGLAGRFFHAPLIAATSGLAVGVVVTSDPARRAQVALEHPEAEVVGAVGDLWGRDDVGFVVIATPTDAHVSLAEAAIDHELPVVVDKPVAPTAAEAAELVRRAEEAEVQLTVFQNRRWDSDHLTLRRLISEGRLGTVLRYESRFERWQPSPDEAAWRQASAPSQGGGQLLDLGSHLVDQALELFGPVTDVYAEVDARRGLASDDDAFLALRHAGGVLSHLRASAVTAAPGPRLRVLGSSGAFVVAGLDSQEDVLRAGGRPDLAGEWGVEPEASWGSLITGDEKAPVPVSVPVPVPVPVRSERGTWPLFYELWELALRTGGPPPVDPRDAVAGLRVLDAARRSAAEGIVVAGDAR